MCDAAKLATSTVPGSGWFAAGILAMILYGSIAAASAAEREHRAHVHGTGQLNVAADGNKLEIELIVPGTDIVGFEHRPASGAEKEAVAAAEAALKAGDRLFVLPAAAGCRLEAAQIEAEPANSSDHDHDHEEPAHEAKSDSVGQDAHAEFHARYRFQCDHLNRLDHIEVGLFQRFPGMRELAAQWASPGGQGARRLTPGSSRLELERGLRSR